MNQHTPPPWKMRPGPGGFAFEIINEELGVRMCNTCESGMGQTYRNLADARLITAAPDLLLAAQEAMRLIELLEALARSDADIYKHELRGDAKLFRSRIAPAIEKAIGHLGDNS